jgi:hypothetical protein
MARELLATVDAGAALAEAEQQVHEPSSLPLSGADDRQRIAPGDRVVLVVGEQEEAERALAAARERGLKCLVAVGGPAGLAIAHEHAPDAIVLAAATSDAALLLDQLTHHPSCATSRCSSSASPRRATPRCAPGRRGSWSGRPVRRRSRS